jgi:hypothetical protein
VLVGGQLAARKGDVAFCQGAPDALADGSPTVLIGKQPAARLMDKCAHGGQVVIGFPRVLIGNPPVGPDGRAFRIPPECAFLKTFGGQGTGGRLARLRDAYTKSPPQNVSVKVPGDDAETPNVRTDVTVRGHTIAVYEPAGGAPARKWLPSTDSVAQGLATLSDEQLRNTNAVYVVPHDGPPGKNGGLPVADCDPETGNVRYFPRDGAHPQSDIDWALQHETGHAYSLREVWANNPGARDAWQHAIAADGRSVTDYGDTNAAEDFAEFMILYADVLGSPCEASARALFPNRFREMDKLFPRGIPAHNPAGGGPY